MNLTSHSAEVDSGKPKGDPREAFSINKWVDEEAKESANLPSILSEHRNMIRDFQGKLLEVAAKILEGFAVTLNVCSCRFWMTLLTFIASEKLLCSWSYKECKEF